MSSVRLINGIMGMAELILRGDLSEEQMKYAETINSSADVLLNIIEDVLDFSCFEDGKQTLNPQPFNLYHEISEVLQVMSSSAEKCNVELIFDYAQDIPEILIIDAARIKQMVINLVKNGIKFSRDGYVLVNIFLADQHFEGDIVSLRFEVEDNGIGIADHHHEMIFEHFSQVDISTTRQYGGTGMGLAICGRIIDLLDGDMGVDSQKGIGSTFWFEVSVPIYSNNKEPHNIEYKKQYFGKIKSIQASDNKLINHGNLIQNDTHGNIKILVVEDARANQMFAEEILEGLGYNVQIAGSGLLALEAYNRDDFDCILMDCMMPEMDGYQTTCAIREIERKNGSYVPIVAMTANAMEGDRDRCLDAGMDDYIAKPAKREDIRMMIEKYL